MLKKSQKTNKQPLAIQVKNLVVAYNDLVILDNISFEIVQGSISAVIGPNGSGKTTLIKSILSLVPFSGGEVKFLGKDLNQVRKNIGYVPQRFQFDRDFPITVKEFLKLADKKASDRRIKIKLKDVGLPIESLSKRVGTLSGGQLQRLLIAQAVLNDPAILILDEPSAGIDVAGEAAFYDIVRHLNTEHNATILMVSHDITAISTVVDNVICVNRNLLCAGPPKLALTQKNLEELYGRGVNIYEHHKH